MKSLVKTKNKNWNAIMEDAGDMLDALNVTGKLAWSDRSSFRISTSRPRRPRRSCRPFSPFYELVCALPVLIGAHARLQVFSSCMYNLLKCTWVIGFCNHCYMYTLIRDLSVLRAL